MSLLHWWPLNGDLKDYGSESVPLINHGATIVNDGKIGKTYQFNGSNNYMSCGLPLKRLMTFTTWVKFTSTGSYHVMDWRDGSGGYQPFYGGTNYGLQNYTSAGSSANWSASECGFTTNKWVHVAVVMAGTYSELYINGALVTRKSAGYGADNLGTKEFRLGSRFTNANWFNGQLNDVRIYDELLTKKQIREISKGLMVHYDFEDLNGMTNVAGTLFDASGYGHNATLYGSLQISSGGNGLTSLYIPNGVTDYVYASDFRWPVDQITVQYWWKSTNTAPTGSYHIPVSSNSGGQYEMSIYNTGITRNGLYVAGSRKVDNGTSRVLLNGQWHACAMTYNGTVIKRYVDGVSEKDTSATGALSGGTGLMLGHYGTNTNYGVKQGYIADFKIYSTALTPEEILQEYQCKTQIDKLNNVCTGMLSEDDYDNPSIASKTNVAGANCFIEQGGNVRIYDNYTISDFNNGNALSVIRANQFIER